jgi:hypothetical protein
MPDTATRTGPELPHLTQKERILHHLRRNDELERTEAGRRYHIGRLSARILDLKEDGYVFDTYKDEDGKAHYSLCDSPGAEPGEPGGAQPSQRSTGDAVDVDTAEDLWRALPEDSLARDYVALLARCAKGNQVIGMLEEAVQPRGVSDWEAAACISRDVTVAAITSVREKLCRASPLVQEHSHRKGKTTFYLHPDLIE